MPRFAAGLEYDGRAYSGWQFQPGLQTVQDAVQRALSRVADAPVECVCAGRTDAGVHAIAQVVALRHRRGAQRARLAARRQFLSTRRRQRHVAARSARAFPRAFQRRSRAAIVTSSSIATRARRWPAAARPGSAGRSTRRACTTPPRSWWANTISAPSAPSNASRNRRCGNVEALDVTRGGEWVTHRRSPPTPSCITWSATSTGLLMSVGTAIRRPSEWPPCSPAVIARPTRRPRRRTDCISPPSGIRPSSDCPWRIRLPSVLPQSVIIGRSLE